MLDKAKKLINFLAGKTIKLTLWDLSFSEFYSEYGLLLKNFYWIRIDMENNKVALHYANKEIQIIDVTKKKFFQT